jgi:DNA-binding response OmpR family regulator
MTTITPAIDRLREAVKRTTFANVIISHDDAATILHALDGMAAPADGIALTRVERSLLRTMKANAGAPVSEQELRDQADTPKRKPLTHASLWVHIRRLRVKLRAHSAGEIQTVRGIGYQWREAEHG